MSMAKRRHRQPNYDVDINGVLFERIFISDYQTGKNFYSEELPGTWRVIGCLSILGSGRNGILRSPKIRLVSDDQTLISHP